MDFLSDPQASDIVSGYVIPWGIKIITAIAIFIIGRMIARAVTKGTVRLMEKSEVDETLRNFLSKIINRKSVV